MILQLIGGGVCAAIFAYGVWSLWERLASRAKAQSKSDTKDNAP